jgi:hypothetical protein
MQSLSHTGKVDWGLVGAIALASAMTGVGGYLKQSPLAPELPKPQDPPKS